MKANQAIDFTSSRGSRRTMNHPRRDIHPGNIHPRKKSPAASLAFGLLFLLAAPGAGIATLFAENVITMGYGEGTRGDRGIEVIVTATNDVTIHGYSLAFIYPTEALSLTGISLIGTHIKGGTSPVNPEFEAPSLDNTLGVGVLGVIFDFSEPMLPKALPPSIPGAYPRIIARLIFDVKNQANGGAYTIELKDGIGRPASFNRFTQAGTSIKPRLENGSFVVLTAGNVLTLDKKIAFAGAATNLPVLAYAQHQDPLAGFQIAITYDKQALTLNTSTFAGTSLGIELGPDKIEAYNTDVDLNFSPTQARVSTAALFDFAPPFDGQTLSPSPANPTDQSLMKYTFSVAATADDAAEWQDLTLSDVDIPGARDNRFIIGDRSVGPKLVHGKIYFSQGNLVGKVIDTETLLGVPGVQVTTEPDNRKTTTGPSGSFRFDAIIPGKYTLLLSGPDYYSSRQMKTESGADIIVTGKQSDTDIGRIPIYKIPTGSSPCEPPDCPTLPFIRGYVNVDTRVDLSDAVTILLYLFQGATKPKCLQAADANDDNRVDLSDAVWMLNYLFGGKAAPPAPFSTNHTNCGLDPTPGGTLDCQEFNC